MFSRFFIERPVFASVLSLLILLGGGVAIFVLPIARYPEITPPTIQITATFPGADAATAATAVAAPIEQQLSGVENLIYFASTCANNGSVSITATFEIGTDQELAAVDVQNRLSVAEPQLPAEVVRNGITVRKSSTNILAVATLQAENGAQYDDIYLSNYATINLLDRIKRVVGVGDAQVFGTKNYAMRIWLDPDKLAVKNLTVSDAVAAVREQNANFPAGTIGQRPIESEVELTVPVLTRGRLSEVTDYENIILVARDDGTIVRLKDVARIELGSQSYELFGRANGRSTTLLLIYLQTGANALETMKNIRAELDDASTSFPQGVKYTIPYDTTAFISASMKEVVHTLLEAVVLVLLVVFVFLQSWRATLIPLLAVPVAIIGTFGGMLALGFSINTLTLFGLVLAIGIVVDDAIVVVENVERIMDEEGLSPREATIKAMNQVSGALIAIVLVLSAVFVPVAFLSGLTGQLYKQFAVTIAVSVAISGLVALTLSPALCAILLKPHHDGRKFFLFRWFNTLFDTVTGGYVRGVSIAARYLVFTIAVFGVLVFGLWRLQNRVPSGFLPAEDQGYIISAVIMPDGASLERTDALAKRAEEFFLKHPAVANVTLLGGLDIVSGRVNTTSSATLFVTLKPFDERKDPSLSASKLVQDVIANLAGSPEGMVVAFNPPSIQGLGITAGFEMQLQQRGSGTVNDLADASASLMGKAVADPELTALRSAVRVTVPQLFVELDREKTKMMGVEIGQVFDTLQAYFGALYVNDFSKFGRVWRVQAQAEPSFRDDPGDIDRVFVRNAQGGMVPLSGIVDAHFRAGPNVVTRFNGFPSVQINGSPAASVSSGQAIDRISQLADETLPPGYGYEWSGETYQALKAGNQAPLVLAFGLIVVFLVLAAQYERWSLPIVVLLAVPIAVLGAYIAVSIRGMPQDIYFQIGLLTLVGLSAKNAILIVEFCVDQIREGKRPIDAALEAARLRFRPIVMTSMAFILGVVPLAISTGAGAAARHSIGTGVIGGMLGSTFIAVFFVPAFFVLIQRKGRPRKPAPMPHS
ncbi:MAG: multidrug efflux RND transporter permease subunit [Phycisphaerales bacterium]|jgi:hydrophobe/amphiphile efflux-1 (HAE1) family protein|nr:multidrug efflux RND transporter permease subunit [Phycisphaerales bacterium]